MSYEVNTRREAALAEAVRCHIVDMDLFTDDIEGESVLKLDRGWRQAAEEAYIAAGGLEAYRVGIAVQDGIATKESHPMISQARRMGTAAYIREGGLNAQDAAVRAYVHAAALDAAQPKHRRWRKARRKANRSLLRVVKHFHTLCTETSWSEALNFMHDVYMSQYRAPGRPDSWLAKVSWMEVFMSIGQSERVWQQVDVWSRYEHDDCGGHCRYHTYVRKEDNNE